MSRVFISYAREDHAIAERLHRDLAKLGAEPWIDKHDLIAGQGWRGAIRQAVRRSSHFIALISKNSIGKRGYVQREMREAIERLLEIPPDEIYLIPARLDESESPFDQIQDLHRVDLFPSYDDGFEKICSALKESGGIAGDMARVLQRTNPDASIIGAYRVLFDRGAFQDPCIFEYALPEVQRATEDVSAAFATGKLFSRDGRLLAEVPPSDRLKEPENELAIQNVRGLLSDLRRTIGRLTSRLNIQISSPPESNTPAFYDMEFHLLNEIKNGLPSKALADALSLMDQIDSARNTILKQMNALLIKYGLKVLPYITLSSEQLKLSPVLEEPTGSGSQRWHDYYLNSHSVISKRLRED